MAKFLRGYQRAGVEWLYKKYRANAGGILGDCMGLGKTVQARYFFFIFFLLFFFSASGCTQSTARMPAAFWATAWDWAKPCRHVIFFLYFFYYFFSLRVAVHKVPRECRRHFGRLHGTGQNRAGTRSETVLSAGTLCSKDTRPLTFRMSGGMLGDCMGLGKKKKNCADGGAADCRPEQVVHGCRSLLLCMWGFFVPYM